MENRIQCTVFSALLVFLLAKSSCVVSAAPAEVEYQREFDYVAGSQKGPPHWGDLKKEWEACKGGDMQSPIDLSSDRVRVIPKLGDLRKNYQPSNGKVKNRGHDISLQWDDGKAGLIMINGVDYYLQQCHWHSPSEHTINGRRYALELHMVHTSLDPTIENHTAVVALLYKAGQPDPFLSRLLSNLSSMISGGEEERTMGLVDPRDIKMRGKDYLRYMGSLTVPPCTQGVVWTINKLHGTVSPDQVKQLREAVHDYAERNARPLQPLNGREIDLYEPHPGKTAN